MPRCTPAQAAALVVGCVAIWATAWLPRYEQASRADRYAAAEACAANPETAGKVGKEQMTELVELWSAGAMKPPPAWLQQAVTELAAQAQVSGDVRVAVLTAGRPNAYATVERRVFFTSALLERLGLTQDELVALAAHEVGHLARRDAIWSHCFAENQLGFDSQGAEYEADRTAVQLLKATGRSATDLRRALTKLATLPGRPLTNTHPATLDRVRVLQIIEGRQDR